MPSPFDTDFDAADALFAEVFGVSVSLQREGSSAATITAEPVMFDHEREEFDAGPTKYRSRHYLIAAADYTVSGTAVDPVRSDKITETINGASCVFEIHPWGDRPEFEWANPTGTMLLVHAIRVS